MSAQMSVGKEMTSPPMRVGCRRWGRNGMSRGKGGRAGPGETTCHQPLQRVGLRRLRNSLRPEKRDLRAK